MLPSTFIKQLASLPRFKDANSGQVKDTIEAVVRRPKPKAAIKKVLDMITDRTRKTNVPSPRVSDIMSSAIREPDTVAMVAMDAKEGEAGDIGAVKPVSRGMFWLNKKICTNSLNSVSINFTFQSNCKRIANKYL